MSSPFCKNPFSFASPNSNPSTHADAERRRRAKLSKQFVALRHVVDVTKSPAQIIRTGGNGKTSVLEDAVEVINDLKTAIIVLDLEREILRSQMESLMRIDKIEKMGVMEYKLLDIDVRDVDKDVMLIRMQCEKTNHPAVGLMTVLKELDLEIVSASLSVDENIMIQHVTIQQDKTDIMSYTKDQLLAVLNTKLILLI